MGLPFNLDINSTISSANFLNSAVATMLPKLNSLSGNSTLRPLADQVTSAVTSLKGNIGDAIPGVKVEELTSQLQSVASQVDLGKLTNSLPDPSSLIMEMKKNLQNIKAFSDKGMEMVTKAKVFTEVSTNTGSLTSYFSSITESIGNPALIPQDLREIPDINVDSVLDTCIKTASSVEGKVRGVLSNELHSTQSVITSIGETLKPLSSIWAAAETSMAQVAQELSESSQADLIIVGGGDVDREGTI